MPVTKPTALLIPISDHNIAQLYNCLAADFHTVVLLASSQFKTQRERFIAVLTSIKPNIALIEADLPDDAENYQALSEFVQKQLLEKTKGFQLELNSTGGTKVIPIALLDFLPIQRIYYKGLRHDYLQSWQPGQPQSYQATGLTTRVSAEQALALYTEQIVLAGNEADLYLQQPDALTIATAIWQQYQSTDSAMSWLASMLGNSPWVSSKQELAFTFTIPDFMQDNADWQNWFNQLAHFSQGQLCYQHPDITIFSHNQKKHPANLFKRWISGDWLEQLVQSWLAETLLGNQLLSGVKPSTTGEQGANRELDFICFHNTAGYVIETKVTTEPRQSANKMVQQLVSLAENFGKLQKVLLLSPLFFQTRPDDSQALKQFLKYCGSHQVKLCRNKTELLALFK